MKKQANRRRGGKPRSDPARSPLLQAERDAIRELKRKPKRGRSAADSKRRRDACRKAGKQYWNSQCATRKLKIGLLGQVFDVALDKLTAFEASGLRDPKQAGRRTVSGTTGAVFHDTLRDVLPKQSRDTRSLWACGLRQALIDGCTPATIGAVLEKEGIVKLGRRFAETRRQEGELAAAERRGTTDAKAAGAAPGRPGKDGKGAPAEANGGDASPRGKDRTCERNGVLS